MYRDVAVQELLDHLIASGRPSSMSLPLAEGRQNFNELLASLAAPEPVGSVEDLSLDGPGGPIDIRLYRPAESDLESKSGSGLPVVAYFHGGGWVFGDLDSHDHLCRGLATRSGCLVVAVDYRRAPEHPFPAAFDDCLFAVRRLHETAAGLGGDRERLGVAGDSSGANLAAAVALAVKDSAPRLRSALLFYPALDPRMGSVSYENNADDAFLSRAEMQWYWRQYLGDSARLAGPSPYAAPALADDLAGMAPTHIIVAGHDPLCDDGVAFANRLALHAVPVTVSKYDEMVHGFAQFTRWLEAGERAIEEGGAVLHDAMREET